MLSCTRHNSQDMFIVKAFSVSFSFSPSFIQHFEEKTIILVNIKLYSFISKFVLIQNILRVSSGKFGTMFENSCYRHQSVSLIIKIVKYILLIEYKPLDLT